MVADDEIARMIEDLRATSTGSGLQDAFVSVIQVEDRTVVIRLRGEKRGDGWFRWGSQICRREDDDATWHCLAASVDTRVWLPGEAAAMTMGLEGPDGIRILRFLEEERGRNLPMDAHVQCIVSHGDGGLTAEYGRTFHHAQTSFGLVELSRFGDSFVVEQHDPAPDWFDGPADRGSQWVQMRIDFVLGTGSNDENLVLGSARSCP